MTEHSFEKFREQVLDDPALQVEIRALSDRRDFITRLVALSSERGYQFSAVDIEEAMRMPAAPRCDRYITPERFRDWVPIRFCPEHDPALVEWCYMGPERFTDPFFEDTIRRRMRQPFNQLFRQWTPIEFLGAVCEQNTVIAPTGFIFHMSRCGSTLVAQMLAALATNIVISEAPPVDAVIRATVSGSERRQWLKWMIGAVGRKRNNERHYFLKFDSWNLLDLNAIRDAFPQVPWIFLYRNPVEVIVSHMRQRGLQMVPGGPLAFLLSDLTLTQALEIPAEEYCARILGRFCSSALEHAVDKNALLVNYDQLPGAVLDVIANHFGLNFTDDEIHRIKGAARFDAKTPQMTFEPDSKRKRADASDNARRAAAIWVDPIYKELENIRSRTAA